MDSRLPPSGRVDGTNGAQRKTERKTVRIALYSHDAMGVGHVRRNLLIAQQLSHAPVNATSLLICGIHEATACACGHGIDCLTLPTLEKHDNDDYRPRDLRISREEVSSIRTATLQSALLAFNPHIMLVDKVPRGIHQELDEVLPKLRQQGTHLVFGMREILDSAAAVAEEWQRKAYQRFIRSHYDAVWVYGDPRVFDTIAEYGFSEIAPIAKYTGYFDQRERLRYAHPIEPSLASTIGDLKNCILCMVGGGQDGEQLATAFARSEMPKGMVGLLVTGPLMSQVNRQRIAELTRERDDIHVVTYVKEADVLVKDVQRVICMGGYNSLLSVVSFEKPALIVPRVKPRMEQLLRAERFENLGFVDVLAPENLSSEALSEWLRQPASNVPRRAEVDLGGLDRVVELVNSAIGQSSAALTGSPCFSSERV
jgi:predicted glycosyltransferase